MLLEYFKSALPEKMVIFLTEQKVTSPSKAAVLADEFVLTHTNAKGPPSPPQGDRECFYCHKKGHIIVDCFSLKHKQFSPNLPQSKGMGLKSVTTRYQDVTKSRP
ncbi:hypothetical protein N1851_022971 [Merluccius polli]|uniref:CCHC-type domain-containing protein n=1 Tax=Merluccius polli TaxID=89951 RepID=A0AA47NVE9_MERPO|nr:hypothetical protein N1851_022971 [Merluccius polli]